MSTFEGWVCSEIKVAGGSARGVWIGVDPLASRLAKVEAEATGPSKAKSATVSARGSSGYLESKAPGIEVVCELLCRASRTPSEVSIVWTTSRCPFDTSLGRLGRDVGVTGHARNCAFGLLFLSYHRCPGLRFLPPTLLVWCYDISSIIL